MSKTRFIRAILVNMLFVGLVGCEQMSSATKNQGAVGGEVSGVSGGSVASQNASGTSFGKSLAPGTSYVIAANGVEDAGWSYGATSPALRNDQSISIMARKVLTAPTADLNGDGYVTLEEVLAMRQAGLSDDEILERLRATNQVFEPTMAQQDYLRRRGISSYVIEQMLNINGGARPQLLRAPGGGRSNPPGSVISMPPPDPTPPPVLP